MNFAEYLEEILKTVVLVFAFATVVWVMRMFKMF